MTTFTVEAAFSGGSALSGTIDITGGTVTAVDLAAAQFPLHFTQIYFNQPFQGGWLLSGTTPGSDEHGEEDYLTFNFTPFPGPTLVGFTQGKITNGAVVHNSYHPDSGTWTTTYYGGALGGTICPLEGCGEWPAPARVPGPEAGGGVLGLALIFLTALVALKNKCGFCADYG